MRWPHLLGLCAAVLFFSSAAPLGPAGKAFAAEAGEAVGRVIQLGGQVEVRNAGALRSLALGDEVVEGDLLRTGRDAYVKIAQLNGSWIFLGADSAVVLSRHLLDPDGVGRKGLITLVLGILRAKLLGPPWREGFEIKTRAAIASVRSTEWIVEARPEKSAVFVVEGEVAVTARANRARVILGPGMGTDVFLGGGPSPAKAWGPERVADVMARTRAR